MIFIFCLRTSAQRMRTSIMDLRHYQIPYLFLPFFIHPRCYSLGLQWKRIIKARHSVLGVHKAANTVDSSGRFPLVS